MRTPNLRQTKRDVEITGDNNEMLKSLLRATAVVAGLATAVLPFGSAEARGLDEILSSGVVRVGVNPSLPPRALYDDNNNIVGFEPEIAAMIAEKLGVELELVRVGSPDRIPFVASDRIDIVMGAMARTAERAKVIDYTVPLHTASYGIVTPSESSIMGVGDLNSEDVTLVQVRGTTAVAYIEANFPNATLLLLDNYNDRDRALGQGRADASFDGIDSVAYRLRIFPEREWRIIPVAEYGVEYSGLGVQKGNDTLRNWLNIALFDLHRTGVVNELWEEWFLKPMPTPVPYSPFF